MNARVQAAYQLREPQRCPVDRFTNVKRAQSIWLTSAPLPCLSFQKCSHPAQQRQTRGFTISSPPPTAAHSLGDLCTEEQLHPFSSEAQHQPASAPILIQLLARQVKLFGATAEDLPLPSLSERSKNPIMPHSFQQKKGETSFFSFITTEFKWTKMSVQVQDWWM